MSRIKLLAEHIIDQIKAGEVVERPSNVLKEIIENSLDAQSSKIDVEISNQGLDLISIKDNGIGISFDDLPYAFCRHATSKLQNFEDLYSLYTYGFRGEALASIGSIAKISCQTISQEDGQESLYEHEAGVEKTHLKLGEKERAEHGCQLIIKELFFNTPARLKFLKSGISEKNAIKTIIHSFILNFPSVEFSLRWDGKDREIFPSSHSEENFIQRVHKVFWNKYDPDSQIFKVQKEYQGRKVTLLLASGPQTESNRRKTFISVNKRLIYDNKIHQLLLRTHDKYTHKPLPSYALFIEERAEALDVNVHPQKTQIKFLDSNLIHSLVSSALKEAIYLTQNQNITDSPQQQIAFSVPTSLGLNSQVSQPSLISNFNWQNYETESLPNTLDQKEQILYREKDFCLFQQNDKLWLIHITKLIAFYIHQYFELHNWTIPEEEKLPLLIGIPFAIEQDQLPFQEWEQAGFEFDLLSNNQIILRSMPELFDSLDYKQIIQKMVDDGSNWKQSLQEFKSNIPSPLVQKILKEVGLKELKNRQIVKEINDEFWQKQF